MIKRNAFTTLSSLLIAVSLLIVTAYLRSARNKNGEDNILVVNGDVEGPSALKNFKNDIGISTQSHRAPVPQRRGVPDLNADLAKLASRHTDMKSMHDRIRAEGRDEAWAKKAEGYFSDSYAMLVGAAGSDWRPTVRCETTLCEVSGTLPNEKDAQVQESLQSGDLMMDSWEHGYHNMGAVFSSGKDGRGIVLMYFQREGPSSFNPDAYSPEWKAHHKK